MQQVQSSLFFSLADPVCKKILSYAPETSLFLTAKQFSQLQEKAKEAEWNRLKGGPISAVTVRATREQHGEAFTLDLFKRLHTGQKEAAFRTHEGREEFRKVEKTWQRYFGRERFKAAEDVLEDVQQELDMNLSHLWFWLRDPLQYAGPPLIHAHEIRGWMSSPAHEADFDRIEVLTLEDIQLTVLSPELAHCKNLKQLRLKENRIKDFPALKDLKQLEYIDLQDSQLEYVPEELLDLPHLNREGVDLFDNPLKVLPEKLYDQFYTWLYWLSANPIDGQPHKSFLNEWLWEEGFLQFSKASLQEIPFSMWLRNRLCIPNLGQHLFECLDELLSGFMKNHEDWDLQWLAMFAISALSLFTCFALWLPCYLINRILALAFVPMITKVRELLGYGRMIHINVGEL